VPDGRAEVVPPPKGGDSRIPRSTLAATVVLGISMAIAFGFVAQRGGLDLPSPSVLVTIPDPPRPTPVPGRSPSGGTRGGEATTAAANPGDGSAPTGAVAGATSGSDTTSGPLAGPSGQGLASASGEASATPVPTLAALTPPPTPAATPTAKPAGSTAPRVNSTPSPAGSGLTGTATASRLRLVTACPGAADCYVYVVRTGDNLFSIAAFFGVDLDRVRELNPAIGADSLIRTGQRLVIPTPTR
jgi:hypothetical protein